MLFEMFALEKQVVNTLVSKMIISTHTHTHTHTYGRRRGRRLECRASYLCRCRA